MLPTAPFSRRGPAATTVTTSLPERKPSYPCSSPGCKISRANPPAGYRLAVRGNGIEAVRTHTRELGVDFVAFEGTQAGKRNGVVVMVVDPQTLDEKAGSMLGLIGRFKHMPSMLRDPIDAQAKKQTGFSISEAANPDTPIGAAVAALDQLRDFGGRGIVLIDAAKQ